MYFMEYMKYNFRIIWRTVAGFALSCLFFFFTSHREMKIKPLKHWEIRKTFQSFFASIRSRNYWLLFPTVYKYIRSGQSLTQKIHWESSPYITGKVLCITSPYINGNVIWAARRNNEFSDQHYVVLIISKCYYSKDPPHKAKKRGNWDTVNISISKN